MATGKWIMAKGKRETPCRCAQPIRVKIVEPGIYKRVCDVCKKTNIYLLEEYASVPGVLKLRWISLQEATAYMAAQVADCVDVEVGNLL